MIIQKKTLIGGHLVGIGKIRKDGSMEYHEVDIHNMITKDGLNTFFKYNDNSSSVWSMPVSYSRVRNFQPWFCLEYCAYGTGQTASDFETTTDLEIQQSIYNNTIEFWPYTGTRSGGTNQFKFRISHRSPAAASAADVRELGWKKKVGTNLYKMFSRVVLPSAYHLEAGEQLVTTYEVHLTFPLMNGLSIVASTPFKDAGGNDLAVNLKQCLFLASPFNTTGDLQCNFPYIDERRPFDTSNYNQQISYLNINYVNGAPILIGPFDTCSNDYFNALYYSTTAGEDFPTAIKPYGSSNYDTGVSKTSVSVQNYTDNTFRRDVKLYVPAMWPKMNQATDYTDISLVNFRGTCIKFGTVDGDNNLVPTPWRKQANTSYTLTFSHVFTTQDAEDWLAQQ